MVAVAVVVAPNAGEAADGKRSQPKPRRARAHPLDDVDDAAARNAVVVVVVVFVAAAFESHWGDSM